MPNSSKDAKPRPVDALFGESTASSAPGYVVEPPLPATTVTPPAPEPFATSKFASIPPMRAAPEVAPPTPRSEPSASADFIVPPAQPAPAAPTSVSFKLDDPRFAGLSFKIEGLYDDVKIELRDSAAVADYCLRLLLQARQACENREYASAEYFVQTVDARLKRSERSRHAARSPIVWLLWLWELVALGVAGGLIALTYVVNLTLFGLPVAPEFIVLLRAMGWGAVGGVIGALYNLPWFFQFREYDPAFNMSYFARPLQGGLVGAVLFLLSQAGILAGSIVLGDVKIGPIFLYVFAVLAGFKVEYVTEFLDGLMKVAFRVPQTPRGMQPPQPPTK
jgi:hypothetical protein